MSNGVTDEMVEAGARAAVAIDSGPEGSTLFEIHWREFGQGYLQTVREAFTAALGESYVVVPREPTLDIIFQGSEAIENNYSTFDVSSFDDHVECAYRAMLSAAVGGEG